MGRLVFSDSEDSEQVSNFKHQHTVQLMQEIDTYWNKLFPDRPVEPLCFAGFKSLLRIASQRGIPVAMVCQALRIVRDSCTPTELRRMRKNLIGGPSWTYRINRVLDTMIPHSAFTAEETLKMCIADAGKQMEMRGLSTRGHMAVVRDCTTCMPPLIRCLLSGADPEVLEWCGESACESLDDPDTMTAVNKLGLVETARKIMLWRSR